MVSRIRRAGGVGTLALLLGAAVVLLTPDPGTSQHSDPNADTGHSAGDNATIVSSVEAKANVEKHTTIPMVLHLEQKKGGDPVRYEDLTEIHTERIHLLIVDPSLEDYQHVHPTKTASPGRFDFEFTPRKSGKYLFFSDLLPAETNAQEYSVAELEVPGAPEPVVRRSNREFNADGYNFVLAFEQPTLVQGKSNRATLKVFGPDGQPFDRLEPLMGAFAHLVGFSEDRRHVLHVHPQGREPESDDERGGPELHFYVNIPQPGYLVLYSQVQINGQDVFAPFGLDVEKREIPNTVAGIFEEVDANVERLRNVVAMGQLAEVHGIAFWTRDVLHGLPKATDLPAGAREKIEPSLRKVKEQASQLDRHGDAGRKAETEAALKQFTGAVDTIREAVGAKQAGASTAEARPLNNPNCPVSGMPVGSMEPGAALVHDGIKIGLCCQGCEPTFRNDPETYLKKTQPGVKEQ
jgi:hypothetical protein